MSADFTGFEISHAVYRTVDDVEIKTAVFLPPGIPTGDPRPVIIRTHGGYWFSGRGDQPLWFGPWVAELARKRHAILIAPDYRLLPEATGTDIVSDLAAFMHWLPKVNDHLTRFKVKADLSRTLLTGESAGGWCVAELALLHGTGLFGFPDASSPVKVRAGIVSYGLLDIKQRFYMEAFDKDMLGNPMFPAKTLDDHIADIRAGRKPRWITGCDMFDRLQLGVIAAQQGRIVELLGDHPSIYPMEILDLVQTAPPMWVYHGADDSAVPPDSGYAFAAKFHGKLPDVPLKHYMLPGEHGLDAECNIEEGWMKSGISWIETFWH